MRECLSDRKTLNALCAPLGANRLTIYTPDLFGIGFEKRQVEFPTEAVDEELLKVGLIADREHQGPQVTQPDLDCLKNSQFPDRIAAQCNRVSEELLHEVNSRFTIPNQHHAVFPRRIGAL